MTHDRERIPTMRERDTSTYVETKKEELENLKSSDRIDAIIEAIGEDAVAELLYEEYIEKLEERWTEEGYDKSVEMRSRSRRND